MSDLIVVVAENGFIINEAGNFDRASVGKSWAFETPESLSKFIKEWADKKVNENNDDG